MARDSLKGLFYRIKILEIASLFAFIAFKSGMKEFERIVIFLSYCFFPLLSIVFIEISIALIVLEVIRILTIVLFIQNAFRGKFNSDVISCLFFLSLNTVSVAIAFVLALIPFEGYHFYQCLFLKKRMTTFLYDMLRNLRWEDIDKY